MQEETQSNVSIRKFELGDVPNKVRWINDPAVNKCLHYELPLEISKTEEWFEKIKDRTDRFDGVIEVDGEAIGLIGLLGIDFELGEAEYYITIGNREYTGKGIATIASEQILRYAFDKLNLVRVILSTEKENEHAKKLYENLGFTRYKPQDEKTNLYYYELKKEDYES